nr:hypothetical protein [Haloarcula sp. 1CSR25-25]
MSDDREDDTVTRLDCGNPFTDCLDDTGTFVTEDDRVSDVTFSHVAGVISVAYAGRTYFDSDFVGLRRSKVDSLDCQVTRPV